MRWTSSASGVETLPAAGVVLATGGAAKVYATPATRTPATGDGIAMALARRLPRGQHGVIQFHPTACPTRTTAPS